MRLTGKVALVNGAANGMGLSEALIFAREGAKVAVADVLETEGRQVADKIKAAGGQAMFVKLDGTIDMSWIGKTVEFSPTPFRVRVSRPDRRRWHDRRAIRFSLRLQG